MKRLRTIGVGALATALLAVGMGSAPAVAGPKTDFAFNYSAFGTAISGNAAVHSGPTARTVACTRHSGMAKHNSLADLTVPDLVEVGGVDSRGYTYDGKTTGVLSRNTIASVSLLGGTISATGLRAQVRSWHNDGAFHNNVKTSLGKLVINGSEVDLHGVNQKIDIPGVGTLVVNQHHRWIRDGGAGGTANVLKLRLTDGTLIRIGHAWNRIDGNAVNGTFWGEGWATRVKALDGTVTSGATAFQPIPCVGTRSKLRENTTAAVNLGGVGQASALRSWVRARQAPTAWAFSSSKISSLSVLGGAIQIDGIEAHVQAHKQDDGTIRTTFHGTKVGKITVMGISVPVPVTPGQQVDLAGLATLTFAKEHTYERGGQVVAVKLQILGQGITIEVGHARAGFHR